MILFTPNTVIKSTDINANFNELDIAIDAINQKAIVSANSNNSFNIGQLLINFGTTVVANSGTTVTFATPFTTIYSCVATIHDTNNQTAWITAKTNTSMTIKQLYASNALPVGWIAIGLK